MMVSSLAKPSPEMLASLAGLFASHSAPASNLHAPHPAAAPTPAAQQHHSQPDRYAPEEEQRKIFYFMQDVPKS